MIHPTQQDKDNPKEVCAACGKEISRTDPDVKNPAGYWMCDQICLEEWAEVQIYNDHPRKQDAVEIVLENTDTMPPHLVNMAVNGDHYND